MICTTKSLSELERLFIFAELTLYPKRQFITKVNFGRKFYREFFPIFLDLVSNYPCHFFARFNCTIQLIFSCKHCCCKRFRINHAIFTVTLHAKTQCSAEHNIFFRMILNCKFQDQKFFSTLRFVVTVTTALHYVYKCCGHIIAFRLFANTIYFFIVCAKDRG